MSSILTQNLPAVGPEARSPFLRRQAAPEHEAVELRSLIEETIRVLHRSLPEHIHIRQISRCHQSTVKADPAQIQQALLQLAANARDAMPRGGELIYQLDRVVFDQEDCRNLGLPSPGNYACIAVRDTGVGMPPEAQQQIFDPLLTSKDDSERTGPDLAMVYGIIQSHRGHILVKSEAGKGSEFRIYLQALPDKPMTEPARTAARRERPPHGTETLLLVEDEPSVLVVGHRMLEMLGYNVLTARHAQEALDTYRPSSGSVALVLVDMLMPKMDGLQLHEALRHINPDVKTLLVSGYGFAEVGKELREKGLRGYVQKPYDLMTLGCAVREALDAA